MTINKPLPIRVLVVDDFKPWLSCMNSMLAQQLEMRIVGYASDGEEAVEQARLLQPDLVLMDVCLPAQSGIEATRQIIRLVPNAKILFVSQHREPVVVRAALSAGGQGYLVKSDAGRELFTAMEAVVQGKAYFSRGVSGFDLTRTTDA